MDVKLCHHVRRPFELHVKQTVHTAYIADFRVISKSSDSYDLLIHDSLIQRDRPFLNSQQSSISMVLF